MATTKRINTSAIMRNAWALARRGAMRFGGTAGQYIAEALRQVWFEARHVAPRVAIGGNRWQKNGMDRIYFNDLDRFVDMDQYGTSNNARRELRLALLDAKVYFDLSDRCYHWSNRQVALGREAVAGIKAALAAL